MTKIPDCYNAYVQDKKILGYLLNSNNEKGASKARFFFARGFTRRSWQHLAVALVAHAQTNDYTRATQTRFGMIYAVQCVLQTPDGTNPCIRSVWEIPDGEHPRLITAYPF
jgi:hypothetical protein